MTENQRILALDAAARMAEDLPNHHDLQAAVALVQEELDKMKDNGVAPFYLQMKGNYIGRLRNACNALANSPLL